MQALSPGNCILAQSDPDANSSDPGENVTEENNSAIGAMLTECLHCRKLLSGVSTASRVPSLMGWGERAAHRCGAGLERGHSMREDVDRGVLVSEEVEEGFPEKVAF